MEFGKRPLDRPGIGKLPGSKTAREYRKIGKSTEWTSDYGSLNGDDLEEKYPSGLMFYDEPPRCQINLESMEKLAIDRLRFLRLIEKQNSIHGGKVWTEDYEAAVKADAKSQHLYEFLDVLDSSTKRDRTEVFRNRSKDHFSHFILRLAYCRTDELRRWFVMQETDAMRLKLQMSTPEEISLFMKLNDLQYTEVEETEKNRLKLQMSTPEEISLFMKLNDLQYTEVEETEKNRLIANLNAASMNTTPNTRFYKVRFTEALELVRSRRVFIENGIAYVPETEMKTLLTGVFKNLLLQNLALTTKILPNLDEDDRLIKMLADLDRRYTGDDYSVNNNTDLVTAEMVRPLSAKSFPMCMKSMQMSIDTQHHLKYKGRLQYGLFLKGIGLTMEEAIRYFRGEFTQSHVSAEKFDKEYVYGIRYNYGKEGKKVNWAPWSCMKVIMDNVGPGENHGCPYRHSDPDTLRSLLAKNGIEGEDLNEIMQITKEGHFQKACALQFRVTHKGQEISSGLVEHPNQFYLESVKGGAALSTPKPTLKTEKVSMYQ